MQKIRQVKFFMQKATVSPVLLLLVVFFFAGCGPAQQGAVPGPDGKAGEHEHAHGEEPYEWSGEYKLPAGRYTLEFQESLHDPSCMIAFLLQQGRRADLEHLAYHIMEVDAPQVPPGGSFQVKDQYAFNLQLNPEGTVFPFEVVESGTYLVFTEHFAWEFEMKIYDEAGRQIAVSNPTDYSEPHAHD
ncbi:MAG: hypothetical protein AB1796_11460 [Bacillota bacterium]